MTELQLKKLVEPARQWEQAIIYPIANIAIQEAPMLVNKTTKISIKDGVLIILDENRPVKEASVTVNAERHIAVSDIKIVDYLIFSKIISNSKIIT